MGTSLTKFEKFGIVSTFIISLCAFSLTIWQGLKMQEHNEMSVMPIINFNSKLSENPNSVSLVIKNRGVGPALIKDCETTFRGVKFNSTDAEAWAKAVKGAIGDQVFQKASNLGKGTALFPGEEIALLTIAETKQRHVPIENLVHAISQFKVNIVYSSVYGHTISFKTPNN